MSSLKSNKNSSIVQEALFKSYFVESSSVVKSTHLKFMDFCAGIGGGRLAFENLGLKCVGFSEIDKNAEKTYRLFFGQDETNFGDLTKINSEILPDFDILVGGFPCQTFSIIGERKGIDDERGEIIFHLIKIMKAKNIKAFLLENVKGLINHDKGRSLKIIMNALSDAGYVVKWRVLDSINHNVPQMRERIYFVGIRKDLASDNFRFEFSENNKSLAFLCDFLIDNREQFIFREQSSSYLTFLKYLDNKYNNGRHTISKLLENNFLVVDTRQSDLRLYINKVPTLRLGRHGILYVKDGQFRKLSGYEALLLQGFPDSLASLGRENVEDGFLLKQTGNAMTVTTMQSIAQNLIIYLNHIGI